MPRFAILVPSLGMERAEHCENGTESWRWFTTTHWTIVVNARSEDSATASEALGKLCRTYWKPVNVYIRSRGQDAVNAQDLTQEFFARFLQKEHYKLGDRDRGRFRSFLLTSVKHFLTNEWERARAQKRGGGQTAVSLDEEVPGEDRPRIELADERTAEHAFDQGWALTLLGTVREKLEAEYASAGKQDRFAQLEQFLPGADSEMSYADAAARLGMPEGTVKSDVHRLKKRYRDLVREEIANTVASQQEIDEELRYLIQVLSKTV